MSSCAKRRGLAFPGLRFHDLRVSLLRAAVMTRAVLLRVYARRTKKADERAAMAIGDLSKSMLGV
jgi:hypothetical protein